MDTRDKIIDLMEKTRMGDCFSKARTADYIISLLNQEHTSKRKDSILTMEAICKKEEDYVK